MTVSLAQEYIPNTVKRSIAAIRCRERRFWEEQRAKTGTPLRRTGYFGCEFPIWSSTAPDFYLLPRQRLTIFHPLPSLSHLLS